MSVYHLYSVEQVALEALPHAESVVTAETDDVTGRVCETGDHTVVCLDTVHASPCNSHTVQCHSSQDAKA